MTYDRVRCIEIIDSVVRRLPRLSKGDLESAHALIDRLAKGGRLTMRQWAKLEAMGRLEAPP